MHKKFDIALKNQLDEIRTSGLFKLERNIVSPQAGRITVGSDNQQKNNVINLCANNYLGLADDNRLIEAAIASLRSDGYGMASVRFICGTTNKHRKLENKLADFLGKDDAILFAACFDANGGLFEALLGPEDAIISDSLNHASLIDGIRLCKARRYRYSNSDMSELESCLKKAREDKARFIMIATDGVFSMDGYIANLPDICTLAEQYDALVMVDDCHATGIMGPNGAGTPDYYGLVDKVDIVTGTLGKALGGAIGGYVASTEPVINLLRQKSRPYLFSNSLPPSVVAGGLTAIDIVEGNKELRQKLFDNSNYWRAGLEGLGFDVLPGQHPIIPVMLGEAELAQDMASELYKKNVFVSGFFYPVVPKGFARIRTQMNAALTRSDLDIALSAFEEVGKKLGVLT